MVVNKSISFDSLPPVNRGQRPAFRKGSGSQPIGDATRPPAPLAEEVELAEDLLLVEVKLLDLGLGHELLPRQAVLLLVRVVEPQGPAQVLDQHVGRLLPQLAAGGDGVLAVGDHLVRDLAEEARHPLARAVVARDGEHHLDVVHQACCPRRGPVTPALGVSPGSGLVADRCFVADIPSRGRLCYSRSWIDWPKHIH